MAGIGDSWGTREELLHPRGPDGRWIRKAGIKKGIIGRILDALANFRPRMFQSQGQANQYVKNVASRNPGRFRGGKDYGRLLSDLGPTNEDLRDGVIDNPSTQRFVQMMDQSATELPDDVILTRYVGVDAFGFTPQTAQGTSSDTDPGIRGLSGKLIADRGYSTTTIGEPRGAPPQGSVRMVIAARKGTKVIAPGAGQNDSTMFLDRDQPLRVTKIEPDGNGGWVMYAMTDEKAGQETPAPIGGPVGAGVRDTKQREAQVREAARLQAGREKRPDDVAEQADFERRRVAAEEAKGAEVSLSPTQEAERRRIELLQQQAGVQPRTEPIQTRSIGGEPRPEVAPGQAPQTQAPGTPEAPAVPRRAVDLRLAVRDAGIPAPAAGPNRKRFNDAYEGVISGKKDPIDAARELDRDAADLEAAGDADADNLRQLSDVIKREYGLEGPAPAKKAAKKAAPVARTAQGLPKIQPSQMQELAEREKARKAGKAAGPEAAPTPPPVPEPAKKAPAKKAAGSGMTRDQEDRVIARAKEFRGNERNEEEQRIVDTADRIIATRQGAAPASAPSQATKAAPAAAPQLTPEDEIKGLFGGKRPTNAQLREMGERNNLGFGPKEPRSEMILAILGARPTRGKQRGEEVRELPERRRKPASEMTDAELAQAVEQSSPSPTRRQELDEEAAKRRTPVKKAAPETPGNDLDRMTKQELLTEAERREVTVPKSWTKDKIKAALRDENFQRPKEKTPEQRREIRRTEQRLTEEFKRREAAGEGVPGSGAEPQAPEAPAPVKKTAKAVPSAAPEPGKLERVGPKTVQVGDSILIGRDGSVTINRVKPGAEGRTVARIERSPTGRYQFIDADGKLIDSVNPNGKMNVRRGGGAPEAAEPPTPTPTPSSPPDILARLQDFDNPLSREEATDLVAPLRKAQLQKMAKELNVPGRSKMTMPELKREIVEGTVGRRLDSIAIRGFTEDRPGAIDRPPTDLDPVEAARFRQERIDRAKGLGNLAQEIDELVGNEAGDDALLARIRSRLKREGFSDTESANIEKMFKDSDRATARQWLDRLLRLGNVEMAEPAGDIMPLDRKRHAPIDGDIPDGTPVRVVAPGYVIHEQDGDITVPAKVERAAPDEIRADERAKKLVPEGSVAGERTQAPVRTEPRKRNFTEAWDAAGIEGEGAADRSMKEIRDDIASGKITPEEGIRRMEGEIDFNQEDLNEVDANLRQPDLTDEDRTRLQSDAAKLQNAIDEQKKASKFLRMYFRDEKRTAPELKLEVSQDEFEVLERATPESLRETAKEMGLEPPRGETKDEILQDMVVQVARQVGQKKVPAKKAAKAAKKVAPPAPKVSPDREKIDARMVGAGIDFDENDKWTKDRLAEVQADLDSGEKTPAAIGRELEERVRSRQTSNVYENGQWHGNRPFLTPEENAEIQAEHKAKYDQVARQTDRMQELAERLKKTRRKPVKKAAAPRVQAAEKLADNAEARLINDRLVQIGKARTREQADEALEGLTMRELQRIGDSVGEKGRSKRELRDKILNRLRPALAELPAPTPEASKQAVARLQPSIATRAKAAGIDRPSQPFSDVDAAEGRARMMEREGASGTEIARMLRERATTASKADLDEEGRRFRVEHDKDTLRSIRKSSAEYLRRLATMFQQEEKAKRPAKKAAPSAPSAPETPTPGTTQAQRAARLRVIQGQGQGRGPSTGPRPALAVVGQSKPRGAPVRGIRGSSEKIYDRSDPSSPLRTLDRPKADEPVYLPNRGNDQGLVHIDSELGGLWLDLYYDEREPNSFVNEIAQIGEQVGTGQLPLAQALERLARMKGRATDQAVADRIQSAIDAIDAPPMDVPELPVTVPGAIRRALQRLADIPTARRRRVGSRSLDRTILEEKADIVRKIDAGEIRLDARRELGKRDLHESGDGATEMWRIFERLMAPEWVTGYRKEGGRDVPIMTPNPDWPEIQEWLRQARERAYARQRGT